MSRAARAHIGTSGWSYPHWRAGFYAGVPRSRWLAHCAGQFTGLEINASFYRLQRRQTLERWCAQTPPEFRFALKANRYLTHVKRLLDPARSISLERAHTRGLGRKLAVVLWQLPGSLGRELGRLESFTRALSRWSPVAHAIEFRHRSWFVPEVEELLQARGVAVCQSDAADWPLWDAVTAGLVYVRLHGHTRTYASAYSRGALQRWADAVGGWLAEGRDVHVYFDNDALGAAPRDALKLLRLIDRQRG